MKGFLDPRKFWRTEEIAKNAATAEESYSVCGVYFLLQGDEIQYVGQSINVLSRLVSHKESLKWDRFAVIRCPRESLDALESLYIHLLEPPCNGKSILKVGGKHAPFSMDQIVSALSGAKNE